ncbi:HupE/UreJ family protein [Ancylobacter sp. A5.8]|uniref:HupE/UreJ family protein n=1 Tax=Ancylobacter gelatini TaxID=2919920 RepID=UPI001F4DB055|nr:HupE/UreJ family protein [Ancylobacter gelatini]MCJ8141958.1 HupE/UreJ family protein [Ancylobacter gelatini]
MTSSYSRVFALLAAVPAALALAATPAAAHHAMDGAMPSTFAEGFISGLAHPVIGVDHLAFLVAVGVATAVGAMPLWMPVAFVAASAVGVGLHLALVDLPAAELVIAASVLLAGVLLAGGVRVATGAWLALFAVAGLFHGYAYGESIVGAEPTPLYAYLAGLVIIQSALAIGVAAVSRRAFSALAPRLAGAAVAGIGFAALVGQVVPG